MEAAFRQAQRKAMEEAILTYYDKLRDKPDYLQYEDYSNVDDEIKKKFRRGTAPVPRSTQTDFTAFRERFGYELPYEIQNYINLFWHSYISGFIDELKDWREAVVLFDVIKYKNENDNDVVYHKFGIIELAESWETENFPHKGKYIPVGWTGYCGSDILYEIETGKMFCRDFLGNGVIEIADSLPQLISKLEP